MRATGSTRVLVHIRAWLAKLSLVCFEPGAFHGLRSRTCSLLCFEGFSPVSIHFKIKTRRKGQELVSINYCQVLPLQKKSGTKEYKTARAYCSKFVNVTF